MECTSNISTKISAKILNLRSPYINCSLKIQNYTTEEIEKYWFFAQNGQGDLWLFDIENKIYFHDHNQEQMCQDNFLDLDLTFEKWLQFADLNKQLENIYDNENEITEKHKTTYRNKLK